ncbi:hypothetical protein [uncultured Aquimarina sp.]|uniref:hypothetical protein n=1 Tax=uncultured Aquimarina sp. TaxID=575652 RepID=UPI00261D54C7|nr:hypothetical protein [uncultured Aquimarina sp.]
MNPNNENTISLETAQDWTQRWRTQYPENSRAYLIPAVDLIEVLNEMGILADDVAEQAQQYATDNALDVRSYMAIEMLDSGANLEKVILVGTQKGDDGVYRDIINGQVQVDAKSATKVLDNSSSGLFDVTSPCPPFCDPNSPLN